MIAFVVGIGSVMGLAASFGFYWANQERRAALDKLRSGKTPPNIVMNTPSVSSQSVGGTGPMANTVMSTSTVGGVTSS